MQINITNMSRKSNGCVTSVSFDASLTEDGHTASVSKSMGIPMKDPADPTFVPYESLTEANVLAWLTSDPLLLLPIQQELSSLIAAETTPPHTNGVPWLSEPTGE